MPTYEYACSACDHQWEEEQRIVEPALDTCPACVQKTARRLISAGNFILKGGGWYADLYSSAKPVAKSGSSDSSASEKSTPAASTSADTKPAAAPSAPSATPAASSSSPASSSS